MSLIRWREGLRKDNIVNIQVRLIINNLVNRKSITVRFSINNNKNLNYPRIKTMSHKS